jgi:hypothetical protein
MSDTTNNKTIDETKEKDSENNSRSNITGSLKNLTSDIGSNLKDSLTNFKNNIRDFLAYAIMAIITILLYFSSSALILFVCKLAQTNILPTDEKCAPYTKNKPNVEKIQTNIFTPYSDPKMSMKLEIPNEDKNAKFVILDMIRKYKEKPNSNFLANYMISIIEPLIQFNYAFINFTMNYVNNLPEYLIVFLGPIITSFLGLICFILSGIYFVYLWFANLHWMFETNLNFVGVGRPLWLVGPIFLSPIMFFLSFLLTIGFILLFFFGFRFLVGIPGGVLFYCMISCLLYRGVLNGKNITSLTIIKEVFKYYKISIITIITFIVILSAFSKLGIIPGIFLMLTTLLIYYGTKDCDIFKPISETDLSPLVSYEQAHKTCGKHGFLYNLILGQSGGSNITKELKKVSKNLDGKI